MTDNNTSFNFFHIFRIMQLIESGTMTKWLKSYNIITRCEDKKKKRAIAAKLEDCSGIFVVLAVGCGTGFLFFFVEIGIHTIALRHVDA